MHKNGRATPRQRYMRRKGLVCEEGLTWLVLERVLSVLLLRHDRTDNRNASDPCTPLLHGPRKSRISIRRGSRRIIVPIMSIIRIVCTFANLNCAIVRMGSISKTGVEISVTKDETPVTVRIHFNQMFAMSCTSGAQSEENQ